ncbi:MAG: DUF1905 domain-containing protein [Aquihabitans sp.]
MPGDTYSFTAELWEWTARPNWFFFAVPEDATDDIDAEFGSRAAGWGSIKVEVTVGSSTWDTSIFPDEGRGAFVLPVKAAVRRAEGLVEGGPVPVLLRVRTEELG